MIRLDVLNLIWSTFSGIMTPLATEGYSATLLNDTFILCIGGGRHYLQQTQNLLSFIG